MISVTAPEVTLELGGELRAFRLDFNALCRFEEATGKSTIVGGVTFTLTDLRALAWAAMPPHKFTLEQVGLWLAAADDQVSVELFKLAGYAFPESSDSTPEKSADDQEGDPAGPLALVSDG